MKTRQTAAATRVDRLTTIGSMIVAFLASQHHSLHMLLMLGLGGAGAGGMTTFPALRRGMVLLSLVLAGITAYRLVRHRPPPAQRILSLLSILLTLGVLTWSIVQFGL